MERTLPQPTNKQARLMWQRIVNKLALLPASVCKLPMHSCVFCGQDILAGERYHNGGYAHRGHSDCLKEVAASLS
jgi:hypothetical protein